VVSCFEELLSHTDEKQSDLKSEKQKKEFYAIEVIAQKTI
jgi:hypothetical protein